MKFELKHLAPYLPYGLKIHQDGGYPIEMRYDHLHWIEDEGWVGKPILRPLSDLTKEIEHNGEKFVPIDKLTPLEGYQRDCIQDLVEGSNDIWHLSYSWAIKLFEWHFDVFNLIKAGLAIDINKLKY